MIVGPIPANEEQRLGELRETGLMDSMPEREFDDLALLASQICQAPIALMTLVDSKRQWFKSRVNLEGDGTPRDVSFCAHAINIPERVFVVPDATADPRFHDNPLVTGNPNIRFYAGMPLVTESGSALGALCVIDHKPRSLMPSQERALEALGRQTMSLIELRKRRVELERAQTTQAELMTKLTVEKRRADKLLFSIFPEPVAELLKADLPPKCVSQAYPEVTLLFAELEGFWQSVRGLKPDHLINRLDQAFTLIDGISDRHGVDRLKTINDTYMGIAGLRPSAAGHGCTATAAAEWALDVQREITTLESGIGEPFSIRIGISTGPVVAGVVGGRKIAYDVWGPTVSLASEMELSGAPGTIQLSQSTYEKLADRYVFERRGEFYVRELGDVLTYLLKGRKPA